MTIQVNMLLPAQIHSHYLAATFDFTTFSPCSYFKGAAPYFQLT